MDSDQQNFQMMADAYVRELQMERVPVVVADHPSFKDNANVAVCYQHPAICVAPDWRERTNLVRMLDDIKAAMEQAKKAQQSVVQPVEVAENTKSDTKLIQQERRPKRLPKYDSSSIIVRVYFSDSYGMGPEPDWLEEVEVFNGGINIWLQGYKDADGNNAVELEYSPPSPGDAQLLGISINLNEHDLIQNVRPEIPVFFQSPSYHKIETIPQYSYESHGCGQEIILPDGFEVVTEEEKIEVRGRVEKIKRFYVKPIGGELKKDIQKGGGRGGYGNRY